MKRITTLLLVLWIVQWQTADPVIGKDYFVLKWHKSELIKTGEAYKLIEKLMADKTVRYLSIRREGSEK